MDLTNEETYPLIEGEAKTPRSGPPGTPVTHHASSDPESSCPIYFGVRSYLHQFYDSSPSESAGNFCEDCVEDQTKRNSRFGKTFWCKAVIWTGINLILIGIIILLVGYLLPKRSIVVGYQDNLEIIDRSALSYNRRLEICRLVGLALFCCGSLILFIALLLLSFIPVRTIDDVASVTICRLQNVSCKNSEEKIPVTEQITAIQPAWIEPNVS